MDVTVSAPAAVEVDVTAVLWPGDGVSFAEAKAAVESALGGFFTGERLGKPVYRAELGNVLFGTGLLKNYSLSAPASDMAVTAAQLPQLGTVTLTEGE